MNLVDCFIFLALSGPAILDTIKSSYCEIHNVVNIEGFKADNSDKYVLITDEDGTVYTCYDFLIDAKEFDDVNYPGTVVYAKYSKLMLDYYTDDSQTNDN